MSKLGGPTGMARELEARIAELELERAALPRRERRPINQQIHDFRRLVAWCKARAGYVEVGELECNLDTSEKA